MSTKPCPATRLTRDNHLATSVFTTLGESDLASRQDSILFDKFEKTPVGWLNRILGIDISTHRLAVRTPVEYVAATVAILKKLGTLTNSPLSFLIQSR